MDVYIFVGPSLYLDFARRELDAIYRPPASAGDLDALAPEQPAVVGLIDGAEETGPALQPREVLRAVSRGTTVVAGGGLGSLMAALLDGSGILGVGQIFEAFRSGALQDREEVAVHHGPPEVDFLPLSEPLVNIRWTLRRAEDAGLLSRSTRTAMEAIAEELPRRRRSYPRVLRQSAERGLPGYQIAALRDWLPRGRVDQTRRDATAVLRTIGQQVMRREPRVEALMSMAVESSRPGAW